MMMMMMPSTTVDFFQKVYRREKGSRKGDSQQKRSTHRYVLIQDLFKFLFLSFAITVGEILLEVSPIVKTLSCGLWGYFLLLEKYCLFWGDTVSTILGDTSRRFPACMYSYSKGVWRAPRVKKEREL